MSDHDFPPGAPGDAPAPGAAIRARRGPSVAFVVVLVLAVVVITLVLKYYPEIGAVWALKPWTHRPVDSTVDKFVAALQARDVQATEALLDTEAMGVIEEGGRLQAIQAGKGGRNPGPPTPPEKLVPAEPVANGRHYYKYLPERPRAAVDVAGPDNTRLIFILRSKSGRWLVEDASYLPGDAKRGVHWQF